MHDYDPEIEKKKKKCLIFNVLKRLIQITNIDLNCSSNKYTLLSYACETNEIEMVSMLIEANQIDVNSYAPKSGTTPLMISIEKKNIEISKLLIKLPKANINIRNYNRKTALMIAVEKNLEEIVDLIINNENFILKKVFLILHFLFQHARFQNNYFH